MEEEVANLREKLEVSDMKNRLLSEECNKMKSQLEGLLHVKEVGIFVGIAVISKLYNYSLYKIIILPCYERLGMERENRETVGMNNQQ